MVGVIGRWAIGRVCGLSARRHRDIEVQRDVLVPMPDGVPLLADIHAPVRAGAWPVVLMRSPYGRGSLFGLMASLFAERGYRVVLQSVRGTGGSGGEFDPMRQELADGAATLEWVRAQPWFADKLFTFGGSYLGNAQWAMAAARPGLVDGAAMAVTLSNFRDELRSGGGYTLEGTLAWTQSMQGHTRAPQEGRGRASLKRLDAAHRVLPIGEVDEAAFGRSVRWWRDWTWGEAHDPWWRGHDFSEGVTALDAPVSAVAGWQDIFLPHQLKDFVRRQEAGKPTALTIGPWGHASPAGTIAGLKAAIAHFDHLCSGSDVQAEQPKVRLYLQKADEWRDYASWPPAGAIRREFALTPGGELLGMDIPIPEGATSFIYDPADPTPSLHGPRLMRRARKPDMTAIERRSDTIAFTGKPCDEDMDLIGPISVELTIRAGSGQCDFYVCLCDVGADGKPMHISDGYRRLAPVSQSEAAGPPRHVRIECWPTAYRLKRGHRLRLIVAGGAFPRFARNLGTSEPLHIAATMWPSEQVLLLGGDNPARICLTVARE